MAQSVARMHLTRDLKCTTWRVPENISARYVRLQLEHFDFLHFAQIEVFGIIGINGSVGRCSRVVCGKQCTVAIVRPLTDPADINRVYRRAVLADAQNADILRERETFALEYDKYGRGEAVGPCIICTGGQKCETCVMKQKFGNELKDLPLGAAGRALTLDEMAQMLLDAPKPALNFTPKEVVDTSFSGMLKRKLDGGKKKKDDKKKEKDKKKGKVVPGDDSEAGSGGSGDEASPSRNPAGGAAPAADADDGVQKWPWRFVPMVKLRRQARRAKQAAKRRYDPGAPLSTAPPPPPAASAGGRSGVPRRRPKRRPRALA